MKPKKLLTARCPECLGNLGLTWCVSNGSRTTKKEETKLKPSLWVPFLKGYNNGDRPRVPRGCLIFFIWNDVKKGEVGGFMFPSL